MQAEEPPPAQFFNVAVSTSSGDFTWLTMTALPGMVWFKRDLCWHSPMPLAGVALWAAPSGNVVLPLWVDKSGLWTRLYTAAQQARLVREHLVNRAAQIAVDGGGAGVVAHPER